MTWFDDCEKAAAALTPDEAQAVLDAVLEGSQLGEVKKRFGLTLQAVCGVVNRNILDVQFLSEKDQG